MGIIRRITREKSAAEFVLSSRSDNCVRIWRMEKQAGVQIGLFLQFHASKSSPLESGWTRVRFAVRNHYPQTFEFARALQCSGGTLADHQPDLRLRVWATRPGTAYQNLAQEIVPVQHDPAAEQIEVVARIACVSPASLKTIKHEMAVTASCGGERRCPCCLQSFHS